MNGGLFMFGRWWQAISAVLGIAVGLAVLHGPAQADFPILIPAELENKLGEMMHPQIVEQFSGVYENEDIGNYVKDIVATIVDETDLDPAATKTTVLNSPIVNAMALPGGYVYATRGLIALANSEAELAGVLGHELGHVEARHAAERFTKGLGLTLGRGGA